ncbi:protease inhibitor I42 family protein [Streptomyces smyrnaeus]|uniref:protease inhibitor I42 family protein n=1 Tax=Streptomyces smyrnaeus TaxID=1387713 RepID=UPI0033BE4EF4
MDLSTTGDEMRCTKRRGKQATLALAVLLAATACGGGGGSGSGGASGGSGGSDSGGDGGSGVPRPREFGVEQTSVHVRPDEQFVLKVPYRPGEGYRWIVRGQRPDPKIVTRLETSSHGFDPDSAGDRGERWYSFRAEKPGSTRLRLRECFQCGTGNQRVDEDHGVTDVTFRITVAD